MQTEKRHPLIIYNKNRHERVKQGTIVHPEVNAYDFLTHS